MEEHLLFLDVRRLKGEDVKCIELSIQKSAGCGAGDVLDCSPATNKQRLHARGYL